MFTNYACTGIHLFRNFHMRNKFTSTLKPSIQPVCEVIILVFEASFNRCAKSLDAVHFSTCHRNFDGLSPIATLVSRVMSVYTVHTRTLSLSMCERVLLCDLENSYPLVQPNRAGSQNSSYLPFLLFVAR